MPPPALAEVPGQLYGPLRGSLGQPPHWMGTDASGFDVFSHIIVAPRTELTIALRHVLPNALTPALIQSSVTIGFAILLTAGLSYVGAGVRPPTPEWGLMIANGANQLILGEWWSSVFPGIAISLTVFGFAVLGNAMERRYERD
jgi:ABC-type dipeptide/oligopeptide/nickel transport system permease subunit